MVDTPDERTYLATIKQWVGDASKDWTEEPQGADIMVFGTDLNGNGLPVTAIKSHNPADVQLIIKAPSTVRFLLTLIARATEKIRELNARIEDLQKPRPDLAKAMHLELNNPEFIAYLGAEHGLEGRAKTKAEALIKAKLGIKSKSELNCIPTAGEAYRQLCAEFQTWKREG